MIDNPDMPATPNAPQSSAAEPPFPLPLRWLPGTLAVCRLDPAAPLPGWVDRLMHSPCAMLSITRTGDELSIIAPDDLISQTVAAAERRFAAFRICGTLDFGLVGILAGITAALAEAGIPVLAVSTFDTDVLLVRNEHRERAEAALRGVGRFVDG